MKPPKPICYIEFDDHNSCAAWLDKRALDDLHVAHCWAVGFLMDENEREYKVSCEYKDDGDGGDTIAIAKGAVTKFKRLNIKV
jgi:hypothetical protein